MHSSALLTDKVLFRFVVCLGRNATNSIISCRIIKYFTGILIVSPFEFIIYHAIHSWMTDKQISTLRKLSFLLLTQSLPGGSDK